MDRRTVITDYRKSGTDIIVYGRNKKRRLYKDVSMRVLEMFLVAVDGFAVTVDHNTENLPEIYYYEI